MTNSERRTIGLDRPLQSDWLDAVAGRLAAGNSPSAVREYAWNLLDGVVAGESVHSARGKTLTVLSRVWLTVPAAAEALRDSALPVVLRASAEERLAVHWAMIAAAYPFFVDVAANVGKSLRLQGEVSLSQLLRRLILVWGDRSTLRPATQRLVRSMVGWGVLRDGGKTGLYLPALKRVTVGDEVTALLVEGLLIGSNRGMGLGQLLAHPAVFPFDVQMDPTYLRRVPRLRIHRQGDQNDFVELADTPSASGAKSLESRKGKAKSRASDQRSRLLFP
jgi:hypothetical protein